MCAMPAHAQWVQVSRKRSNSQDMSHMYNITFLCSECVRLGCHSATSTFAPYWAEEDRIRSEAARASLP